MPSKELTQAIECISDILGSDNEAVIGIIDKTLNARGISPEDACQLVEDSRKILTDKCAESLKTIINSGTFSSSSLGIDKGALAGYAAGLSKNTIESATGVVLGGIDTFSDTQGLAANNTENVSALESQEKYLQGILDVVGYPNNIKASDVIDDTVVNLLRGQVDDVGKQTKDGVIESFKTLSKMVSDVVGEASEAATPDFSESNMKCQDLEDVDPFKRNAEIGLEIARTLCDVYNFVADITTIALNLEAALADPLRGLNLGVDLIKSPCVSLVQDLYENGLPEDICQMNHHYNSIKDVFFVDFGNQIIEEVSEFIRDINNDILDAKSKFDEAWFDIIDKINPCDPNTDFESHQLSNLISANEDMFNAYNKLNNEYNNLVVQNYIEPQVVDTNGETQIIEPLNFSKGEIDYLNDQFRSSCGTIDEYLNRMRDVRLSEQIKEFDYLDKSKVFYRCQNFDLNKERTLDLDTEANVTGQNYNYSNGSELVIKCNEF